MAEEKILTKHPQGKSGKNIDRRTYDLFKEAIIGALNDDEISHAELFDRVAKALHGKFEGNISWYAETVKLDLEARRIIDRASPRPLKYSWQHSMASQRGIARPEALR